MSFHQKVNRIQPQMPTQNYTTFAIKSPISTHYRRATCAEVNCADYLNGWYLKIEGTPEDLLYLATHSGRRYTTGEVVIEKEVEIDGAITVVPDMFKALIFEAGQGCFAEATHVKSLERQEFYFSGRGDYRSFSIRKAHLYDRPDQFVDDFDHHLTRIRRALEQG